VAKQEWYQIHAHVGYMLTQNVSNGVHVEATFLLSLFKGT
jgi:hypothetical protein